MHVAVPRVGAAHAAQVKALEAADALVELTASLNSKSAQVRSLAAEVIAAYRAARLPRVRMKTYWITGLASSSGFRCTPGPPTQAKPTDGQSCRGEAALPKQ